MERQPGNLLRPETVLIKENDLKSNIQSDFQLPTFGKDRLERARTCAETACPRELFNRSVYDRLTGQTRSAFLQVHMTASLGKHYYRMAHVVDSLTDIAFGLSKKWIRSCLKY